MPKSLVHQIAHWASVKGDQPALQGKRDGQWTVLTWSAYWENVQRVAKGLIALGHQPGDCVAIVGANRPEWVQIEFGAQAARGIPAPIYGTSTIEQMAYIVRHSESKIVACDATEQLTKFLEAERQGLIEGVRTYLTFAPLEAIPPAAADRVVSFEELLELGDAKEDAEFTERLAAIREDEVCIMIYTSGTTGVPKGVEIDHGGQFVIGEGARGFGPEFYDGRAEYHAISYLPLSHQAEQLMTNVVTLMVGGTSYFCPEIAQVKDYLTDVRPTVFLGVPRVWEKFEAALRARLNEATGFRAKLAKWAMDTELSCFKEQVARGLRAEEHMPLRRRIARALVIDKIKTALGLDRLVVALTGSAPMAPSTQEFFASLGICVYEVYGLTETSGAATITDPRKPAFGTVGKPFEGVEIRIGDEDEIQLRGRNMVRGYRGMPDESKALYTEDGWLRTGDAGSLDAEGNLKITGRLKELIITAGGKNVAPVELEFYLQSIPGVGQAVVVGDRKPYLSALITLDPENLETLAEAAGVKAGDMAELAGSDAVRRYLEGEIEARCNAKVARYQTIKKFRVLPRELSIEAGELTASMKKRRPQIAEAHRTVIESFYA
ncbi:MAG: long-chain fatty acid--CoA ligase [Myxococcota bacterium]